MTDLERLTIALNKALENTIELKAWLERKEITAYMVWKNQPENEKSREAMDKVVARLKLLDEEWLQKEDEYRENKIKLEQLRHIFRLAESMVLNDDYNYEVVDNFIKNTLKEI